MNINDKIPRAVREFIQRYIDSVELLEVLLLLQRDRSRGWSTKQVTDELRSSESSIANRLLRLKRLGFLEVNNETFRFAPKTREMEADIGALARAYLDYRLRVVEEIYRRRDAGLKTFADAFRLRQEEDGDG